MQERGGDQGDYRDGMQAKIANAVRPVPCRRLFQLARGALMPAPHACVWYAQIDCLKTHSHSKRAIIPIPFNSAGSETVNWHDAGQTKCCRELHLYIEVRGVALLHFF